MNEKKKKLELNNTPTMIEKDINLYTKKNVLINLLCFVKHKKLPIEPLKMVRKGLDIKLIYQKVEEFQLMKYFVLNEQQIVSLDSINKLKFRISNVEFMNSD